MAVQSNPTLILTPRQWCAKTTGASTVPDASTATNIVQIIGSTADYSIGSNGGRVDRISAVHAPATAVTNTAGQLRVFVKAKGATFYLALEAITGAAIVRSATVIGFKAEWTRGDGLPLLILNPTDELWVASEKADLYSWIAIGGDY